MYNLLISHDPASWNGELFELEFYRCVREYTDPDLTEKYGALDESQLAALTRFPCVFAYELANKKDPKFGLLKDARRGRDNSVRIRYEIVDVAPFLTWQQLEQLSLELDIGRWELNRTHWALKDVNLAKELHAAYQIKLPAWAGRTGKPVDLVRHKFDVGLSFPGESRDYVEKVARELEALIGPDRYFYDQNYVSQLARPALDRLLQTIYRDNCRLIVVFLSAAYERKNWCGLEFRLVSELVMERANDKVMYVRMDDADVSGVLKTDGYIDGRKYSPKDVARFIGERIEILRP